MKRIFKLLGIAVLAAVIGVSMMSCDNDSTASDPIPPPPQEPPVTVTSSSIKVSGATVIDRDSFQPVTGDRVFTDFTILFVYTSGSLAGNFSDAVCEITDGKLTIDLGVPTDLKKLGAGGYNLPGFVPSDAMGLMIQYFTYGSSPPVTLGLWDGVDVRFGFIYYDQSEPGKLNGPFSAFIFNNVTLKKGWNMVKIKDAEVVTNGVPSSSAKWELH